MALADPPTRLAVWLAPFSTVFTSVTWLRVLVLVNGAILAPHRRTVSAALRAMGRDNDGNFARYHAVLNRARWSALATSRILLDLLIDRFAGDGPIVIGLDDTIERRWGAKIKARGIYRDPVRSSHGHFVKASGLRWLSAMLLVPLPWAGRVWALPFLTILVPSQRSASDRGTRHKTLIDGARQMILQIARWLPDRRIVVVTDSGFSAIDLLDAVRMRVCMVTRLRLDARLFAPAPKRKAGTLGRPRRTGERLPTLAQRLATHRTRWRSLVLADWYGGTERRVEIVTGCAVWSHPGRPIVPLRWLLVRDPTGTFKPQAFVCTALSAPPVDILSWFVRRWTIEVTFAEARRHLGVEAQRQWSDMAIARTTPVLLGLFALVAIWADDMQRTRSIVVRSAGWYRKQTITFSDALAAVRRQLWTDDALSTSPQSPEMMKIPRHIYERITDIACYAT
ncbi:transposase [Beijerinckia sp. L45]|uniref:IS701 family transposase n=1 Tax=Beijerinckia sp. L45 TaxID=1641855 RepID=UPI001AEE2C00|nr:transposase [Beijerinckia sp. L45]